MCSAMPMVGLGDTVDRIIHKVICAVPFAIYKTIETTKFDDCTANLAT